MFVFRIYAVSQTILFHRTNVPLLELHGCVLLLVCGLLSVSLARSRAFNADIYPSHNVLYRSLTFLLAGVYLLVVGVLAQMVKLLNLEVDLPVRALVLLVALIGGSALLLSERIRQRMKRFVSRHFRRPLYDVRQVWATFTQQTTSLVEETELSRKVSNWLADTFQFLSVTIWLTNENKDRLVFGASTSIPQAAADSLASASQSDTEIIREPLILCSRS